MKIISFWEDLYLEEIHHTFIYQVLIYEVIHKQHQISVEELSIIIQKVSRVKRNKKKKIYTGTML